MKANELREGNFVEETVQMFSGPKKQIIRIRIKDMFNPGKLEGVPLTPDWLERAGFIKDFNDEEEWDELFFGPWAFIQVDKNGFTEVTLEGYEDSVRVQFVHQLQNLYFCLCGTELTFTEKP